MAAAEIHDVPEFSVDWYREVTGLAHTSPGWVQTFAGVATEAVLLILGALVLANLWRTRRRDLQARIFAYAAPVLTLIAYGLGEFTKTLVEEERPCRAVLGVVATIAECPKHGDWSLPSNHTTIAAAAAVALSVAWRRLAIAALALAALEAFLRVFVGVHYPHDVLAGFLLGTLTVAAGLALTAALAKPLASHQLALTRSNRGRE